MGGRSEGGREGGTSVGTEGEGVEGREIGGREGGMEEREIGWNIVDSHIYPTLCTHNCYMYMYINCRQLDTQPLTSKHVLAA